MVGKVKMKDWKAAVRNWKTNHWMPGQPRRDSAGVPVNKEPLRRSANMSDSEWDELKRRHGV
jgi:hypothetical protein